MAYFNSKGQFVSGQTMGGSRFSTSVIEMEVEDAVYRCVNHGASAHEKMKHMLKKHPVLKTDQWLYPDNPHPLSALVAEFVRNIYS